MTMSPDQLGVFQASPDNPLPVGFANVEIYSEYHSLLAHMIVAQAADAHPSWERNGHGTHKRCGKTGPKTPEALKAWFERNHPERVKNMSEAIRRAVHVKHGLKPPKLS